MHADHILVFEADDDRRLQVERIPVAPVERMLAAPANDVDEYADTEPTFAGTGPARGAWESARP